MKATRSDVLRLSREDHRPPALGHLRVLDLSDGVAGQFCGKLFAGYGADVVLAEQPGGTSTRTMRPLIGSGPRSSLLFRHLNQGKRARTLPAAPDRQLERIAELASDVDVIIAETGTTLPPLGSGVVECRVSDFPEDGPYASWRADEMIHQALSGYMNATGRSDREPLFGVGHRAYYACGTTLYVSALAAVHARRRTGKGQRVRATVFESIAAIGQNFVTQAEYNGTTETRARYTGLLATLRCADGYVVMFAIRDAAAVCRVFDAEHLIEDPRFARPGSMIRDWDTLVTAFAEPARRMTTEEVVSRAQTLRISCERVWTLAELVDSDQWQGRGVVRTVGTAPGAVERAMGPLFRISGSAYGADTPSPDLASEVARAQTRS